MQSRAPNPDPISPILLTLLSNRISTYPNQQTTIGIHWGMNSLGMDWISGTNLDLIFGLIFLVQCVFDYII